MSKNFTSRWGNIPDIARYLLLLMTAVLISFLFPNNARFHYHFEKGHRWHHDDLYADFDFGILKSDEELRAEKESLQEQVLPFYEMDMQVARAKKQSFRSAFENQVQQLGQEGQYIDVIRHPKRYLQYADRLIDNVYKRGIIQLAPHHENSDDKFVVQLRVGNSTSKQTLPHFLKGGLEAEPWVTDSLYLSRLKEAEFLIPLFDRFFTPNIFYNDTLTTKFKTAQLQLMVPTRGKVESGELIIARDEFVTEELYQTLRSYRQYYEQEVSANRSWLNIYVGYFLLTALILLAFVLYLLNHSPAVFRKFSNLLFMVMWLLVYSYLVYVVEQNENLNAYIIPFCIAPLVIRVFFNEHLALITHIVIVLIASFLTSLGYEFTFLTILAGVVAILTRIEVRNWTRFFTALLLIFGAYALGYFGLSLIEKGSVAAIDWRVYQWLFLNVFLTLLAYPLVPLLERLFGFLSPFTLVELSDMNKPLLRELSIKAPGTLQHSLQVANLAEAAAAKIKANAQLVKTAALYHDIGKIANPSCFIENQTNTNPHNQLSEVESAQAIIDHVTQGVAMAKKHGLPAQFIDFIKSHHGTTRVEYFYRNFCAKQHNEQVDDAPFRYPGPRPRTKEEAILMIADSLEAAAKSLKDPGEKEIDQLVEKIIEHKIQQQQLARTSLSFRELAACKMEFKKLLKSIYHVRVEYPEE